MIEIKDEYCRQLNDNLDKYKTKSLLELTTKLEKEHKVYF